MVRADSGVYVTAENRSRCGRARRGASRRLRLQAWMFLQQLIPIIDARIASQAWPKAPSPNRPSANWTGQPRPLVTRASVLASCPATIH